MKKFSFLFIVIDTYFNSHYATISGTHLNEHENCEMCLATITKRRLFNCFSLNLFLVCNIRDVSVSSERALKLCNRLGLILRSAPKQINPFTWPLSALRNCKEHGTCQASKQTPTHRLTYHRVEPTTTGALADILQPLEATAIIRS